LLGRRNNNRSEGVVQANERHDERKRVEVHLLYLMIRVCLARASIVRYFFGNAAMQFYHLQIARDYRLHVLARGIAEGHFETILDEQNQLWTKLGEDVCRAEHPLAAYYYHTINPPARSTLRSLAEDCKDLDTTARANIARHLRGLPPHLDAAHIDDMLYFNALSDAVARGQPPLYEAILEGLPEYMWGDMLFDAVRSRIPCPGLATRLAERAKPHELARAWCAAAALDRTPMMRAIGIQKTHVSTALCLAAHSGCLDAARYLVEECGADVNACDGFALLGGGSPIQLAATTQTLALVQYLLDQNNPQEKDYVGQK
jgi:hypothetical protein